MSSGLECLFFENQPGEWFYALESDFGDRDAWDWREEAEAYGPFPTYEVACVHLQDNHQNPGGHSITNFEEMRGERDETLDKLVAGAAENMKRFEQPSRSYGYRRW